MQQQAMTEQQLADAVNAGDPGRRQVSQSWISRVCVGDFKRIAGQTARVLRYANIPVDDERPSDPGADSIIGEALNEVWDGSIEGARAIARLLKGAAALAGQGQRRR
jgi:hypothetical protein